MAHILILGTGRQGRAAALDLLHDGDSITLVDRDAGHVNAALEALTLGPDSGKVIDLTDTDALAPLFAEADGAVFAADYALNEALSRLAIENRCFAVDFGGNHDVVDRQHGLDGLAHEHDVAIVPDTGLTPGLAGVLVSGGIKRLGGEAHRAEIRVGGLPLNPGGPLKYGLTFSVKGLINEYIEPSVVIDNGEVGTKPSLDGLEMLTFGSRQFEAFYTSGGVSTLPRTFKGVLKTLDCKTIRYPGHARKIKFLFDLGFGTEEEMGVNGYRFTPRRALEAVLEHTLPHDPPDEVLMRVTVVGANSRRVVYTMRDEYDAASQLTAMQRCTAWPGTRVLKMMLDGTIPDRGVLYQEVSVDADVMIAQLAERGVRIKVEEK